MPQGHKLIYSSTGKENLTNLAIEAAWKTLEMADVLPGDVYLILMCSSTGDDRFGDASTDRGSCILFGDAAGAVLVQMNDKEIFKFSVRVVLQLIEGALEKASLAGFNNFDWLLLHQANQRIIDGIATLLEVPLERVISNLANYGNTSAASIPLALDEGVRSGKVQPRHDIAAAGFGAGLTWASAIFRWG
ncbi:3-oxoacyl-[acyl-carrier-protein] synthase III, chloroplastic [Capsicum annuum]|nr:3-oxoacyl-[acyl-carrier-protein] synthase III, chloroplastic [Capsicum annuum]